MSLIEVLVAVALMALVLAATADLLGGLARATVTTSRRDGATTLAYRVLETARALSCGLSTGSEQPATLATRQTSCFSSLSDASYTDTESNGSFPVRFSARWESSTAAAAPTSCSALSSLVPTTLRREVDVTFTQGAGTGTTTRSVVTREAVPPDAVGYNMTARGGIVVSNLPAATTASLAVNGGYAIPRYADPLGCAWFPFLLPGAYTLTTPSGPKSVTVTAGSQVVVPN